MNRSNINPIFLLTAATALVALASCSTGNTSKDNMPVQQNIARANLLAVDGTKHGVAIIAEGDDKLLLDVEGISLTPGKHGAHIHMTGNCDAPDFKSAGGHWNPTQKEHGTENPAGHHMGDFLNLEVTSEGKGVLTAEIPGGTLKSGPNALLDADGAAFIIHEGEDDMKSDPAGDAGSRVACGVFELQDFKRAE